MVYYMSHQRNDRIQINISSLHTQTADKYTTFQWMRVVEEKDCGDQPIVQAKEGEEERK